MFNIKDLVTAFKRLLRKYFPNEGEYHTLQRTPVCLEVLIEVPQLRPWKNLFVSTSFGPFPFPLPCSIFLLPIRLTV